jgi:hypothetical protein
MARGKAPTHALLLLGIINMFNEVSRDSTHAALDHHQHSNAFCLSLISSTLMPTSAGTLTPTMNGTSSYKKNDLPP